MPRRKPQPAAETAAKPKTSTPLDSPKWKVGAVIVLFFLVLLAALWSAGAFNEIKTGPKIPLVRQVTEFSLGTDLADIRQKFPSVKKDLRPFNGDAALRIVTLDKVDGATSVDLLFYHDKLYFMSVMWQGDAAKALPFEDWAKQSRRWKLRTAGNSENLGEGVKLKESRFNDGVTEMTLRDLSYGDKTQRWQELRDSTNQEAQTAFAKYRLDNGS